MAKCSIETLNAILVAVFDATNGSLSAHVPLEAVLRRFPGHLRGDVRRCIKELIKRGLLKLHPTRGSTTYQLTQRGLECATKLIKGEISSVEECENL
jgi:predicted nuclease with RNAse H fold